MRNPGEINGQPFDVVNCKKCVIILADYTNQVCELVYASLRCIQEHSFALFIEALFVERPASFLFL